VSNFASWNEKPTQQGTPAVENLGKLAHSKRSQKRPRQAANASEDTVNLTRPPRARQ
jgi:hypothetical protein